MKEESQIDEMRAALRGDRERAEQARQRSTENVRALLPPEVPGVSETQGRSDARRGLFRRLLGR